MHVHHDGQDPNAHPDEPAGAGGPGGGITHIFAQRSRTRTPQLLQIFTHRYPFGFPQYLSTQ